MASWEEGFDEGIVCCGGFGTDGAFEGEGVEPEEFEAVGHEVDE